MNKVLQAKDTELQAMQKLTKGSEGEAFCEGPSTCTVQPQLSKLRLFEHFNYSNISLSMGIMYGGFIKHDLNTYTYHKLENFRTWVVFVLVGEYRKLNI